MRNKSDYQTFLRSQERERRIDILGGGSWGAGGGGEREKGSFLLSC